MTSEQGLFVGKARFNVVCLVQEAGETLVCRVYVYVIKAPTSISHIAYQESGS